MTRFENLNLPRPVYTPLFPDLPKIRLDGLTKYTPLNYNLTPPVNPQDEQIASALFACAIGYFSTVFTAIILTRTSFESKTKTAISLAGGATVTILTYTDPVIGFVAFAILIAIAVAIGKEPSSTDGLLKMLTPDNRHNFPRIDPALMQHDWDALFRRQAEQIRRNLFTINPIVHPRERMPLPRFVLPHFFFDPFPAIQDLQSHTIAGG
jgi:hypothetical protein